MIVHKLPIEIDWNHWQSVQVKAWGEGSTLANQLDWDAHLRIYIPFENLLSTPKQDRHEISIFCSPVMMGCRCIFSPLFSQLPRNNASQFSFKFPRPPKKHRGILFNPTNITSIVSHPKSDILSNFEPQKMT